MCNFILGLGLGFFLCSAIYLIVNIYCKRKLNKSVKANFPGCDSISDLSDQLKSFHKFFNSISEVNNND